VSEIDVPVHPLKTSFSPGPPLDIRVLIDDGEKKPFDFPGLLRYEMGGIGNLLRIGTETVLLTNDKSRMNLKSSPAIRVVKGWGDITIEHFERVAAIEVKRSLSEIDANVNGALRERARFLRAMDRLAAHVRHPSLFLNMNLSQCCPSSSEAKRLGLRRSPDQILDKLSLICAERHVPVYGPISTNNPKSYRTGELVLRVLLLPFIMLARKRNEK